jgi:leucyl-tRNA---protein transferase
MQDHDINEYAYVERLTPEGVDGALAAGWRHFGEYFFRYSDMVTEIGDKLTIQPLRLRVAAQQLSKSQRRILRKNDDVSLQISPTRITPPLRSMFHDHKARFVSNMPGRLEDFLGESPGSVVPNLAFQVYDGEELIAVSFLDVGRKAVSSVYAMFAPEEGKRSLGHYTMLAEVEWARNLGFEFYYPGYGSVEPSVYDYKKSLQPLEVLNWQTMEWGSLI